MRTFIVVFLSGTGFDKCFVLKYNYVLSQELVERH
jgi:hypothetical protein